MYFFFKQKTAYEMRISDWSSDVCSSDLEIARRAPMVDVIVGPQAYHRLPELIRAAVARGASATDGVKDGSGTRTIDTDRSQERRVGKECVSRCRSRWSPYHSKKNTK